MGETAPSGEQSTRSVNGRSGAAVVDGRRTGEHTQAACGKAEHAIQRQAEVQPPHLSRVVVVSAIARYGRQQTTDIAQPSLNQAQIGERG